MSFPLTVSSQLYLRMYPSEPPVKTQRMSGVAATALIDVPCGAAMVGRMSYVSATRASGRTVGRSGNGSPVV